MDMKLIANENGLRDTLARSIAGAVAREEIEQEKVETSQAIREARRVVNCVPLKEIAVGADYFENYFGVIEFECNCMATYVSNFIEKYYTEKDIEHIKGKGMRWQDE
jgi:microsomal dipeptidase-like Zn-dependent dipeptidase